MLIEVQLLRFQEQTRIYAKPKAHHREKKQIIDALNISLVLIVN